MKQAIMQIERRTLTDAPGLGKRIKEARKASPRTLKALAEAAGMHPVNWYRIEEEKQVLPIETLRKIEAVLGVDFGVED